MGLDRAEAHIGMFDLEQCELLMRLIANGDEWMAMIQSRNRSTHTYNEKTAKEVGDAILSSFVREFETFCAKFTDLERQEP